MKKYNNGGDELRVKTAWGDLVTIVGHDEDYPEVYVCLEMPNNVEFTLAVIGQDGNVLRTRVKENLGEEDFTSCVEFSNEVINEAYNTVIEGDTE